MDINIDVSEKGSFRNLSKYAILQCKNTDVEYKNTNMLTE